MGASIDINVLTKSESSRVTDFEHLCQLL